MKNRSEMTPSARASELRQWAVWFKEKAEIAHGLVGDGDTQQAQLVLVDLVNIVQTFIDDWGTIDRHSQDDES